MPPVAALAVGLGAAGAGAAGFSLGTFGGTLLSSGALMTAGLATAGYGAYGMMKKSGVKMPGYHITETPKTPTVIAEDVEGFEEGWEEVLKKAKGRRSTILTEPMLAQTAPFTQRATLLGG